jgi:LuxR family maltose regulon positive regulatory protein
LQTVQPALGESLFAVLQTSQPPPAESLLSGLLNEIAALPGRYLLILDDYHLLDSPAVDSALVFLLDYLPPQLHLVIAGREDPNLPLARLRARGQLTELRAANLRFTSAEASEFLNRMMGLNLPEEQIAAIESRTEGWIAGLQLAALAMQGEQDTARFIQSFTGSHRFVLDYLLEEVLNQQPQSIQDFLLRTSIISIRLDLAQDDHRIPHIFR